MTTIDRLHEALGKLEMGAADALVDAHLESAVREELPYADFLVRLLDCEIDARRDRITATRMRMSGLPFVKTIAGFDFSFQPSVDPKQINELATLRFVHEAQNVVFLGPPGVGKTHLAVALSVAAIEGGFSCCFATAHNLVTTLGSSAREGRLKDSLRYYLRPKVLVIDEVGYLPLDEVGANILFQLISARYEKGSIILTSNKSYTEWGHIFGETTIATALLDRLLHHSTTVNIRGESYRLKERRKAGLLSPQLDKLHERPDNK
jgi:DNA replication protein DnaC